jgi:hypothetical protein
LDGVDEEFGKPYLETPVILLFLCTSDVVLGGELRRQIPGIEGSGVVLLTFLYFLFYSPEILDNIL